MDLRKLIKEEIGDFDWAQSLNVMDALTDEEKSNNYRTLMALQKKGFTREESLKIMAEYVPPRERFNHEFDEDTTYWSPENPSSTFQFNYPPKWNSLTRKFVDWVRLNPGGTKKEFYIEALGFEYRPGHNQQFFGSILHSGIVKIEKGPRGTNKYFLGPNYESWTKGKLKRYMGVNVPWRYR